MLYARERRTSSRFEVAIPFSHPDIDFLRSTAYMTHDISSSGVGIVTANELAPGSNIHMRLIMPDNGEVIESAGTVIWTRSDENNLFRSGVSITGSPLHPVPLVLRTLALKMGLGRRF